jgi:hypothetical protein
MTAAAAAEAAQRFEAEMTRGARSTRMLSRDDRGEPIRPAVGKLFPDHLSPRGAAALAERIKSYWAANGHPVETVIERFSTPRAGSGFAIRSDLVDGLPGKRKKGPTVINYSF